MLEVDQLHKVALQGKLEALQAGHPGHQLAQSRLRKAQQSQPQLSQLGKRSSAIGSEPVTDTDVQRAEAAGQRCQCNSSRADVTKAVERELLYRAESGHGSLQLSAAPASTKHQGSRGVVCLPLQGLLKPQQLTHC